MSKTRFSGHNTIWGAQWGTAP